MPVQHQQLLTTLEDIAKTQSDKYFAHPIHCDKEGCKITYTDEESNVVSGNYIMIKTFPYCDSFSWQVVQDNEKYFGEFYVNYDYEGEYVCCYNERCISDFIPDQQSLPIFADFRNALQPIKKLLED